MKVSSVSTISLLCVASVSAFTPQPLLSKQGRNVQLFESGEEDVIEKGVQEEMAKTDRMSKFANEKGVDYAPWMKVSVKDEARIRQQVKEREAARQRRLEEEKKVSGALRTDSQAQELSGAGLRSKVLEDAVELEWSTSVEGNTAGFIVKRRAAKTEEFDVIASFEDWGPLVSKGPDGGVYRFLDTTATAGSWVYRVTECENNGNENDLSQCLVDIQTDDEKLAAKIAVGGFGAFAAVALAAGLLLDPNGGF